MQLEKQLDHTLKTAYLPQKEKVKQGKHVLKVNPINKTI